MPVRCPKCSEEIAPSDVNAGQGVAFCRRCSEVHHLKALAGDVPSAPRQAEKPDGTRVDFSREEGHIAAMLPRGGAKGAGCFMLFFAIFWNALTWTMFVGVIAAAFSDPAAGLGALFMLPFIAVGAAVALVALWLIYGRTSIAMNREATLIRRELLGRSYTKRWPMSEVEKIDLAVAYTQNYQPKHGVGVFVKGRRSPVVFGSGLSDAERDWLVWELYDFWRGVRRA